MQDGTEPQWTEWVQDPGAGIPTAPGFTITGHAAPEPHPSGIFTGGLDYTPVYYRRGYLLDDSGLILQPFASVGYCLNPGSSLVIQPYLLGWGSFSLIDEWHLDLRKPKGESDMGKAGLSWDDGGWQPSHHRQGGPPCAIVTEGPFALRCSS